MAVLHQWARWYSASPETIRLTVMTTVDFYYSMGSRYSYLASTRMEALARDTGCDVNWIPLNSGALGWRKKGNPFAGEPVSGQYDWDYREQDARRWATHYGVPFIEPRGRVQFDIDLLARAATAAKRLGQVVRYTHALFAAMFADPDVTQIDRAECARRAVSCGIAEDEFLSTLDDPATATVQAAGLAAADAAGVFGVPSFVVGGELFWGNDRLVLLRDWLRDHKSGGQGAAGR
jgi:2-hydroxychromene-2-carboxylate isomerase